MSDRREIAAGKAAAPTADRASSSCRGGGLRPNWGGDGAAKEWQARPRPRPWLPACRRFVQACSQNGNPDRYAAAICIRVRPDRLLLGYSGDACRCCERPNAPLMLSGRYEVFVERLFLSLLG